MHYIHLEKTFQVIDDAINVMSFSGGSISWDDYIIIACKGIYESDGLNTLLNYPDDFKFDLILTDYICGECMLPILHRFKYPPLIGFTPFNNAWNDINFVGGHWYPAYIPFWSAIQGGEMNFFQRLYNTYLYTHHFL
jgi:hypothetical protein